MDYSWLREMGNELHIYSFLWIFLRNLGCIDKNILLYL